MDKCTNPTCKALILKGLIPCSICAKTKWLDPMTGQPLHVFDPEPKPFYADLDAIELKALSAITIDNDGITSLAGEFDEFIKSTISELANEMASKMALSLNDLIKASNTLDTTGKLFPGIQRESKNRPPRQRTFFDLPPISEPCRWTIEYRDTDEWVRLFINEEWKTERAALRKLKLLAKFHDVPLRVVPCGWTSEVKRTRDSNAKID